MDKKLAFIIIFFLLPVFLEAKVVDKTVAVVNGEVILLSEFEKRAEPIIAQYEEILMNDVQKEKRLAELKEDVLEMMIDEKLLLQQAKAKGIMVTEKETNEALEEIKSRFTNEEEFNEELKKQNLSLSEYKKQIQQQLIVNKLIEQEIGKKVKIPTDKEVETFYQENEEKMVIPEQVRVRHILISFDGKSSREELRKKAEDILAQAKKGTDFVELAKKYSDDSSAINGGDLGYFARGEMVPEFEAAAFSLQPGEISDIIETKYGFHIIKCVDKKPAQKQELKDVQEYLRNYIYQLRMQEEYTKWLRNLRDEAIIKKSPLE